MQIRGGLAGNVVCVSTFTVSHRLSKSTVQHQKPKLFTFTQTASYKCVHSATQCSDARHVTHLSTHIEQEKKQARTRLITLPLCKFSSTHFMYLDLSWKGCYTAASTANSQPNHDYFETLLYG